MQTLSVFCQKTSSRIAKTEMYVSTRNLGRKIFCWKNCVCVIFFQKWAKNFRPSGEFFFGSVVKTAFDVSIISLWETFFEKIQILFSILASWANPFRHSVEDFRAGLLENTILILVISGYWANNFRSFDKKNAVGLPKVFSRCLQKQFEKNNFLKKSL